MAPPIDPFIPLLKAYFNPNGSHPESTTTRSIIQKLNLQPHPEGGYFVETDRDPLRVPSPFKTSTVTKPDNVCGDETRSASTTIFYYLTPKRPLGHFHRNNARTVHTLHQGRGRYVIIHADEVEKKLSDGMEGSGVAEEAMLWAGKARVDTFVVGQDVLKGEKLQWIVEGGKYKASFLLPDAEGGEGSDGCLISETVVPGFEYADHDFLEKERFGALVTEEQAREMRWMVRKV